MGPPDCFSAPPFFPRKVPLRQSSSLSVLRLLYVVLFRTELRWALTFSPRMDCFGTRAPTSFPSPFLFFLPPLFEMTQDDEALLPRVTYRTVYSASRERVRSLYLSNLGRSFPHDMVLFRDGYSVFSRPFPLSERRVEATPPSATKPRQQPCVSPQTNLPLFA